MGKGRWGGHHRRRTDTSAWAWGQGPFSVSKLHRVLPVLSTSSAPSLCWPLPPPYLTCPDSLLCSPLKGIFVSITKPSKTDAALLCICNELPGLVGWGRCLRKCCGARKLSSVLKWGLTVPQQFSPSCLIPGLFTQCAALGLCVFQALLLLTPCDG